MNTEIESLAVLLKGTVPHSLTDQPAVLIIYVLLVVIIGAALACVVLRNVVFAIASFAGTMAAVAFLYLFIQPYSAARAMLFAAQLIVATLAPAVLMLGLVRRTSGLARPPSSPNGRENLAGAVVASLVFALFAVVVGRAAWPVRVAPDLFSGLARTITDSYVVALAALVVLVGASTLGVWLLLGQRAGRHPAQAEPPAGHRRPRSRDRRGA